MTVKEKRMLDAMGKCLTWAITNLPNKPIIDERTLRATTWHAWFRDVVKRSSDVEKEDE